tara:strand:- start:73 stop:567 length:495 start_codon:yes stop_codon:yes gene_type:complete
MLNHLNKNFLVGLLTIFIIFSLDRISKYYVISQSEKNLSNDLLQSKFLNINLIWNEGIAFGFLSFGNETFYNIISILISIIIIILLILIFKAEKFKKYSYIIICGGALGNLFDRIIYKSVPDFIDFHYNGFHWFIFNIADIFISLGVLCLIYDEIFLEKKRYGK